MVTLLRVFSVVFSGFSSKDKVYYTTSTTETKQNSPHYSFFSSRILFSLFYIQVFGRSKESDNKVKKVIAFPVKILSRRRRSSNKKNKKLPSSIIEREKVPSNHLFFNFIFIIFIKHHDPKVIPFRGFRPLNSKGKRHTPLE